MNRITPFFLAIILCPPVFAQLGNKDTVRKIEIYFKTSNDILSGTDNDVWFDIGPKAWRISDGFEKGSLKKITIDNPSKLTFGVDGYDLADQVPLLVEDIKIVRIEKKGIRPCEFIPGLSKDIIDKCADIGGLSNAPDSRYEMISPDVVTPAGQVKRMKTDIGTAEALLIQAQGALKKAQDEYNKIIGQMSETQQRINQLKKVVNKIPAAAAGIYNDLQTAKSKLITDKIPETIIVKICDDHSVWKIIKFGLFGPSFGWVTERVCHDVPKLNPLFQQAVANIEGLEKHLVSTAGQIGAAALDDLSKAEAKLTDLNNTKIALKVTMGTIQPVIEDQRNILKKLKDDLHELDKFIREKMPFLDLVDIPHLNQWKLERVVVLVNGKDFRSYNVNKRFKQGKSSWTANVSTESKEMLFLNKLRVNQNKGNTGDGITASATSPFFKEREISGWDDEPLLYGTVTGTLVNPPNRGYDGFVSLDLKVDTFFYRSKKYVLDGKHGINHARYIRCEYLRIKPDGSVDDGFNNLQTGQRLKIAGRIYRDLDRQTYYELHPEQVSEVVILK